MCCSDLGCDQDNLMVMQFSVFKKVGLTAAAFCLGVPPLSRAFSEFVACLLSPVFSPLCSSSTILSQTQIATETRMLSMQQSAARGNIPAKHFLGSARSSTCR